MRLNPSPLVVSVVVLLLSACASSDTCGAPLAMVDHAITPEQRSAIDADAGTGWEGSCQTICGAFHDQGVSSGAFVTCATGTGDAGDVVTCTYPRLCR